MKYKSLKLGSKLRIGFGFCMLILLMANITEFVLLTGIEKRDGAVSKGYEFANAVLESKNHALQDMQIRIEIMESKSNDQLNKWSNMHGSTSSKFESTLAKAKEIAAGNDWGGHFKSQKAEIQQSLVKVDDFYKGEFLVKYDICKKIRTEILTTDGNLKIAGLTNEQSRSDDEINQSFAMLMKIMDDLEVKNQTILLNVLRESKKHTDQSKLLTIFILLIGIGFIVMTGTILIRAITRRLEKSVEFAKFIAGGDLTAKLDSDQKDEIGELATVLNLMTERLHEFVLKIRTGIDSIDAAGGQICNNSRLLSEGAARQASSTEEVSSSVEEMAGNIQQNTDNARQTERISKKAAESMMEMSKIGKESLDSIKTIAEKITIINDIAFQTNLLALNAAIEAARAGEHGRGFAVVAAEVRKLAERSKQAADEIEDLSRNSLKVTEDSRKLLNALVPEIQKTSQLVQEITSASIEQNAGTEQINSAIQQLNMVTQQNAASSEEMATSSEKLTSQTESLKSAVSFFKLNEERHESKISHYSQKSQTEHKKVNTDVQRSKKINTAMQALVTPTSVDPDFESF